MVNKGRHFCIPIIARVLNKGICWAQVFHVETYWRAFFTLLENWEMSKIQQPMIVLNLYKYFSPIAGYCLEFVWHVIYTVCVKSIYCVLYLLLSIFLVLVLLSSVFLYFLSSIYWDLMSSLFLPLQSPLLSITQRNSISFTHISTT